MRPIDLFAAACSVLESTSASPAVKKAAADALIVGLNEGIPLPKGAAFLIWSFWTGAPANRSWRNSQKLGEIADDGIRAEAIAILDGECAGDELRDLALDVLVGKAHAAHLPDALVLRHRERSTFLLSLAYDADVAGCAAIVRGAGGGLAGDDPARAGTQDAGGRDRSDAIGRADHDRVNGEPSKSAS